MHLKLAILSVFVITCNGLSIEKVSENNKSVTITRDAFKDKHDNDELEKHRVMATKKRIKKRLVEPFNYKLSAFEETDDYFDKGGGDGDNNEGNYESKDWSDLNREPINIQKGKVVLQNLDLTNIEGIDVVKKQSEDFQSPKNIVNRQKSFDNDEEDEKQDGNPLIAIHTTDKNNVSAKTSKNNDELNDYYDIHKTNEKVIHNPEKSIGDKLKKPKDNQDISYYDEPAKQDENPKTTIRNIHTTTEKIHDKRRKTKTNYAVDDYYDGADKLRSEAEQAKEDRDNEAKKLKILGAVDDLKERHSLESKLISEKFKEEELQREEFERNNLRSYPMNSDNYRESSRHKPRGKVMNDYEEYEERPSFHDKYKQEPISKTVTTVKSTTTAVTTGKPTTEHHKMSIFRSPQLYMAYEDADDITELTTTKTAKPFTVSYSTDERISLIPEDAKEGEPTLFMPKKFYKNRKQKNILNIIPQEYTPQSKYRPNKNIKATTLAMISDNYFPTTDISFTMAAETLYSTEVSTEHEEQLRSKPTVYKYKISEEVQPQRTTETDYYTKKNIEDNNNTEKNIEDGDYTEKTNGYNNNTQKYIEDSDYTEKNIGDNSNTEKNIEDSDYPEKPNGNNNNTENDIEDSDYTEKNIGDSDSTEKNIEDSETDMSGVGSDLNSLTNENFDGNSTAYAKYSYIEPEISLARQEETTEFSSDGSEDSTRPIILQVHDDLAPESSNHLSDNHNGKVGGGRQHDSEQESGGRRHDGEHESGGRRHDSEQERGGRRHDSEQESGGRRHHSEQESGGRRHNSEHEREYKEQGKKKYESEQEQQIIAKGFHDARKDISKYDSHDQAKETYGDDSGHSATHDHEESGKKHAEYEETGKHSKGHSTKGSHDVHKKEEYEKKEEFFDYSGDEEDKGKKSRAINSYNHSSPHRPPPQKTYAFRDFVPPQPKKPTIRDNTREKWIHHHAHPARTNNLRLIDRRRDLNNNWSPLYLG